MDYFIGIDIGTTATKAVAFDDGGGIIAHHSVSYDMQHPQDGWAEQSPDVIWHAVTDSLNIVQALCFAKGALQGVSFSAAMHSLIAVDADGTPLTNCIIWADNRAASIAEGLRISDFDLFRRTGTPIHAMSPLVKILWLRQNLPDVFRRTAKFVGIKEYIFFKIFGKWLADVSLASATGLMNLEKMHWDEAALDLANIRTDQLSDIRPPQYFERFSLKKTAKHTETTLNLPDQTPFVLGASDGCLANLGSDATQTGDVALTVGTSGAIRAFVPDVFIDEKMRTFCYRLDAKRCVIGGGTNSGAFVLQWFKEEIVRSRLSFGDFYATAAEAAAGSDGLLMLPYLMGERAPIWDSSARGAFVGISAEHRREHFIRAAMEGVIFHLFSIGKILNEHQPTARILAGGGFAQSPLWVQIVADVFQKPVVVGATVETSARGAVIIGREALGLPPFPPLSMEHVFEPNPLNAAIYGAQSDRFSRLYEALRSV